MDNKKLLIRLTIGTCDLYYWYLPHVFEYRVELVNEYGKRAMQAFPDNDKVAADDCWNRLARLTYKTQRPKRVVRSLRVRSANANTRRYRVALFRSLNMRHVAELGVYILDFPEAMQQHDFWVRTKCRQKEW